MCLRVWRYALIWFFPHSFVCLLVIFSYLLVWEPVCFMQIRIINMIDMIYHWNNADWYMYTPHMLYMHTWVRARVFVRFNVSSSYYCFSIGSAVHVRSIVSFIRILFAHLFVVVIVVTAAAATATATSIYCSINNEIHAYFWNIYTHSHHTLLFIILFICLCLPVCKCIDRRINTYIFIININIIIINHCRQINKLWLTKSR